MISFRPARPDDAAAVTQLCLRSKAVWGYSDEFMAACRAELTLTPEAIASSQVEVAEQDGSLIGMSQLVMRDGIAVLDKLYVAPEAVRSGAGRALFRRVMATARAGGAAVMTIDADPNAAEFYRRMGAVDDGTVPSGSIPGRALPRLRVDFGR